MSLLGIAGVACGAGFGRKHVMHEDRFFELGGSLVVEVEFIVSPHERQKLLDRLARKEIHLFYADIAAKFGELRPAAKGGSDR